MKRRPVKNPDLVRKLRASIARYRRQGHMVIAFECGEDAASAIRFDLWHLPRMTWLIVPSLRPELAIPVLVKRGAELDTDTTWGEPVVVEVTP